MGGSKSKVLPEVEHPRPTYVSPGKGAPLLTGVRVLELATVVAAPSMTRNMAIWGAEVIKVEEKAGDPWRKMLRDYEVGREKTHGSLFEITNLGKSSVALDLKMADDLNHLHTLMSQADVFVTNLRPSALGRLRLDYSTVSAKYPGLIFAHLSAYGSTGEECDSPGYDVSAFWARTGMGAGVGCEGSYTHYPTGFGDSTTGMAMLGGVLGALRAREMTGRGALVDGCLLRSGAYMMQAQAVEGKDQAPPPGVAPDYKLKGLSTEATYAPYKCSDGRWVTVLGCSPDSLGAAVGLTGKLTRMDVQKKVNDLSFEQFRRALETVGISSLDMGDWPRSMQQEKEAEEDGVFLTDVRDVDDIPKLAGPPVHLSCSKLHGQALRRAPMVGEHTTDIIRSGFSERPEKAAATPHGVPMKGPLAGVEVFEVAGNDACVASCGTQLAELGATVFQVKVPGSSTEGWSTLAAQLRRGKQELEGGLDAMRKRLSALNGSVGQVGVVVMGTPFGRLEQSKCRPEQLREEFPEVVVAALTPRGLHAPEAEEGHLAWWLKGCGFVRLLFNDESSIPPQLGALITSVHLTTAVCCGVFHATRTGEGQIVDVSYLRSGVFANHCQLTLLTKDPAKERLMLMPLHQFRKIHPVPTAQCHVTSDGYWLQLLGVDMPRHLGKTLKALGLGATYPKVVCGFCCCCNCRCCAPSLFEKLEFMFEIWNEGIKAKFAENTRAELIAKFKEHDVWWCDIKMPCQMLSDPQLAAIDAFTTGEGGVQAVKCPVQVTTQVS